MAELTDDDWGRIHAKAWRDEDFKNKLESDPRAAIEEYCRGIGKQLDKNDKILHLHAPPSNYRDVSEEVLGGAHPFAPWCC
jgi:hypothetical protein